MRGDKRGSSELGGCEGGVGGRSGMAWIWDCSGRAVCVWGVWARGDLGFVRGGDSGGEGAPGLRGGGDVMYEVGWGVETLSEVGAEGFVCLLCWGQRDIRFKAPLGIDKPHARRLGFSKGFR